MAPGVLLALTEESGNDGTPHCTEDRPITPLYSEESGCENPESQHLYGRQVYAGDIRYWPDHLLQQNPG